MVLVTLKMAAYIRRFYPRAVLSIPVEYWGSVEMPFYPTPRADKPFVCVYTYGSGHMRILRDF